MMLVRASKRIQKDCEVTCCYADYGNENETPKQALKRRYGFDCSCPVCVVEDADPHGRAERARIYAESTETDKTKCTHSRSRRRTTTPEHEYKAALKRMERIEATYTNVGRTRYQFDLFEACWCLAMCAAGLRSHNHKEEEIKWLKLACFAAANLPLNEDADFDVLLTTNFYYSVRVFAAVNNAHAIARKSCDATLAQKLRDVAVYLNDLTVGGGLPVLCARYPQYADREPDTDAAISLVENMSL
jgi:hypothetical protein